MKCEYTVLAEGVFKFILILSSNVRLGISQFVYLQIFPVTKAMYASYPLITYASHVPPIPQLLTLLIVTEDDI